MAGKLTARGVETAKLGTHGDGGGLYLVVSPKGAKKWVFRFKISGKQSLMGLGSAELVTLAEARDKVCAAVTKLATGAARLATAAE